MATGSSTEKTTSSTGSAKSEPKPDTPQERARTADTERKTPTAGEQAQGNAAASGDPAVQQLLAERQTASMNNDTAKVQEIDNRLKDLGF